jgi:hypothetical protein
MGHIDELHSENISVAWIHKVLDAWCKFFLKMFQIFFEVKGLLHCSKKKLKTYWGEK